MLCCAFKKNLFTSYCEEWTVKGKREAGRQGASRSGRRGWIGTILQWKAQQALVMGCLLGVGSGQRRGGRTRMIPGPLFPPLVCPFLLYYHLGKMSMGLWDICFDWLVPEFSNLGFCAVYFEASSWWYGALTRCELITYPSSLRQETSHLHHRGLFITTLLPYLQASHERLWSQCVIENTCINPWDSGGNIEKQTYNETIYLSGNLFSSFCMYVYSLKVLWSK